VPVEEPSTASGADIPRGGHARVNVIEMLGTAKEQTELRG